jgi:hypothetical protein
MKPPYYLYFFISISIFYFSGCSNGIDQLQNGDLIFQQSKSAQSNAISFLTQSKYTHIGMIYRNDSQLYVLEAVEPIQLTPLEDFIDRGVDRHFVVKRLQNADSLLTPSNVQKMQGIAQRYLGKKYDNYFEWNNSRFYCSELVWKIYKQAFNIEIGQLQRLGDFDLSDPTVVEKVKARYGKKIPINEPIISPAAMFNANVLETILEN